ncbi:hypothetical protein [Natronococcus jeotgali]|uniref:Uncharacterized protein n=1 Tax=Natronococcus jeotgali DSM 18795 TaxID=1227498 RepID=L9WQX3_9EURY|nr:hypothetical protein [Natronococcus jeotgali]ELY51581.1 hypothetical protein C492_20920 [Natronococcus jeotgali DSM 18795]
MTSLAERTTTAEDPEAAATTVVSAGSTEPYDPAPPSGAVARATGRERLRAPLEWLAERPLEACWPRDRR